MTPLARRRLRYVAAATGFVLVASAARAQAPASANPAALADLSLEELMRVQVVESASSFAQSTREAPSSVTIVTADDIRRYGYRTLADVLRYVRGFWVVDDRNYTYVGVRGFHRPGDYNSRLLVLVNGVRVNENIYDGGYVADEGLIDLALADRVEIVRGPSASLYGNNAFFGVVNVITRRGQSGRRVELAGEGGRFRTAGGRATVLGETASGWNYLASGTTTRNAGANFYYREFDAPETQDGRAVGLDEESANRVFATASRGGWSLQFGRSDRDKGIPTASYGALFGAPVNASNDELTLAAARWTSRPSTRWNATVGAHYARYRYDMHLNYGPPVVDNFDVAEGDWVGTDLNLRRTAGAHTITAGAEIVENLHQRLVNYDVDPYFSYSDARITSRRAALFAQDEVRVGPRVRANVGVRVDRFNASTRQAALSQLNPRGALIVQLSTQTTLKTLYGAAFRTPNMFESAYDTADFYSNPNIDAERIKSFELVVERTLGRNAFLAVSAFSNRIRSLIGNVETAAGLTFENTDQAHSKGIEAELTARLGRLGFSVAEALQRTTDPESDREFTSSPRHVAQARAFYEFASGSSVSLATRGVSRRLSVNGGVVPAYAAVDASASLAIPGSHARITVAATDLLDSRYLDVPSEEHVQRALPTPGRAVVAGLRLGF